MALDKAIRERAARATCLLIDGQPVNPWLVKIDFAPEGTSQRQLELHLGLPILIFELQQCEADVKHDNILAFVLDDVKDHRNAALDGYLTIVRHVVNPPPRRKSLGWFARMFTPAPKWSPPLEQWKWTSVTGIRLSEDALVINGTCHKISTNEIV